MKYLLLVLVLLMPAVTFAQPVGPPAPLDLDHGLVAQFEQLRSIWFFALFPAANSLFWKLAALDFALAAIMWVSTASHLDTLAAAFFRKIMWISMGFTFLLYADTWMPMIVDSFIQVGAAASGLSTLSPGQVFTQGLGVATQMLWNMAGWGIFKNFVACIVGLFCAFVVIIAYGWMAIELAVTLMEAYLVMGAGVFLLAFSPFRGTVAVAERYLGFVLAVGLKLFVLYLIMGAGVLLAPAWGTYINAAAMLSFSLPLLIAASVALFAAAVFRAEKLAASIAQGSVNFSAGDVIHGSRAPLQIAATALAQTSIALTTARLAVAATQAAGGGVRGALTGARTAAQALTQASVAASVPRLQQAADTLGRQVQQTHAGKGNTP